jgi:hypothetical protein
MKALVISEYAHHSKIPLTLDAPGPILEKDSDNLLIDVYSAGLNFFDVCVTPSHLPADNTIYDLLPDPSSSRPLPNPTPTPVHSWHRIRRDSSSCTSREPIQAWGPRVRKRAGLIGGTRGREARIGTSAARHTIV